MSNLSNPALRPAFSGAHVPARGVLADAIPGDRVRDLLLILGGAGLTALAAQITIHIPGTPVPVTAQTLAVVLAGSALGMRRGAASQLLYLLLGLFLPIYAGGASGGSVVWGADGGYLIGFIVAAGLIGWGSEHGADRRLLLGAAMFALGQFAIYVIGVPWFKVAAGISWGTAIHEGFTIFIVSGIVKAIVAALCMPTAWRIERRVRTGR
jgi:biotin transport system substrate-specific component